jgi:hypothetical protein
MNIEMVKIYVQERNEGNTKILNIMTLKGVWWKSED